MPFVRPIVYVYRQFTQVTVSPGVPDLTCCLIGPAYHIQDYPADKTDIYAADFVKSGFDADAPCSADGSSAGRPDPGSDFLTLSDPPNHVSGGVLDADSVQIIFDDAYIELQKGTDGAVAAANTNVFTSASADFVTNKVAPGDKVVMTDTAGSAATTITKTVKEVVDANTLDLTSTFKTAELTTIDSGGGGTAATGVLFRVEHKLDDQDIDESSYATIVSNEITIKTGPTGVLLSYEDSTWPVNYAKIYVGYRELRTDLGLIQTIESTSGIESAVGRVDERNPLAAAAQVALANTGTPIFVFGTISDDLAGHTDARDKMSTRDDLYALVPLTDSMSGSTWTTVIGMWKTHAVAFAEPEKSNFRVIIGSYDVLPTEKSSAPPSSTGHTVEDPTGDVDVFVDPATSTQFITDGVVSTDLLDITHADGTPLIRSAPNGETIFNDSYAGAHELLGAMGDKRLRVSSAFAGAATAERVDYFVREAILQSEGGSPVTTVSNVNWATSGGAPALCRISKAGSGAFANVLAGDIIKVSGAATALHNEGFLVDTVVDNDTVDIYLEFSADANSGSINIEIYRPTLSMMDVDWTNNHTFTKAGAFANVAVGDMCIAFAHRDRTVQNQGLWVVTSKDDDNVVVAYDGTYNLTDPGAAIIGLAFYRTRASNGGASITTRKRLTRLRDDNASFLTTVSAGELIEIPYPADSDPLKWDTTKTTWPIDSVVSDEILDADLTALEELGPDTFIEGFDGDMDYRIAITLQRDSQVTELNSIVTSVKSDRLVMVWPNECLVSGLSNELTGEQNRQSGQYLAAAVGGMVAGLPSHQGFTFIGIGGVQQIFNANNYFTDNNLTSLRDGGWYVFVQDSEASLPYTIHEVTTDVTSYETGEFMAVKNYDYIARYLKEVVSIFRGEYNITPENLELLRNSIISALTYQRRRVFPKIGTPVLDFDISSVEANSTEVDQVDAYVEIEFPKVLNKVGLYLRG